MAYHLGDMGWNAPGNRTLRLVVREALDQLKPGAPVVVMIHGYKFTPERPIDDPHRLIYALRPEDDHWKIRSWPAGLGFCNDPAAGLCIGYAWPATARENPGDTAFDGNGFARVYEKAKHAGKALAHLLDMIAQIDPGRRIDLIAHSLGARVALKSIRHAKDARIGRVILMGSAEFAGPARRSLAGARSTPEVYNITARSNTLYDILLRLFAPAHVRGSTPLGFGLKDTPVGWVDLDLDAAPVTNALAGRGLSLGGRRSPVCHWGFYIRKGSFCLYRSILRDRTDWSVAALRSETARPRLIKKTRAPFPLPKTS
ncbi:alpha/beta hydrolase [Halovulum sp. GXIMD14793]